MNTRTDEDLIAQSNAVTSGSIARQLGEAICAKTQAETTAAIFHDELMNLRAQFVEPPKAAAIEINGIDLQARIDQLTRQLLAAGLEPEATPEPEPHAIDHADDAGGGGSAAMLHAGGAPAAHPDFVHPGDAIEAVSGDAA